MINHIVANKLATTGSEIVRVHQQPWSLGKVTIVSLPDGTTRRVLACLGIGFAVALATGRISDETRASEALTVSVRGPAEWPARETGSSSLSRIVSESTSYLA